MLTEIQPLEHFSMMVSKAMKGQGIKASPMAEFYLSNLLTGFIDASRISDKTFSERFLKALGAEGGLKKILLKELADSSLFISGFFHESLKRKIVDVDYYMDMGIISYNMLSEFFSGNGRDYNTTLSSLYREMSEKFLKFADILDEISEESSIKTALDLLRLYERWLKTKSKRTETLLRELGIDPVSVPVRPVH